MSLALPTIDLESARALWDTYRASTPGITADLPVAEYFGDSVAQADELIGLLLDGTKRATAGLVADYEADSEPLPQVGQHWIACDGTGRARAVIRVREVRIGALISVDDRFAWDEGEGDRSRDYWLAEHRAFFERRCAVQGLSFDDESEVVFERFDVVTEA